MISTETITLFLLILCLSESKSLHVKQIYFYEKDFFKLAIIFTFSISINKLNCIT